MTETTAQEFRFEADVESVLRLVINSLYSNKEIFLRELVSNASDALDKLRFEALTRPELTTDGPPSVIRLEPDATTKTLTIHDTGIGMSRDELQKNLGTIARSGTREFLAKIEAAQRGDLTQIGQFGVGFYSAFLVADHVEVVSRRAGESSAWKWSSGGKGSFTVEPATRDERGTSIILHLKDEQLELLKSYELERLVREYSDYLSWPIEVKAEREKSDEPAFRRANQGTALWQRSQKDVTAEQVEELYKHLTHDWEKPLAHRHFKVEGATEFAGYLFIPRRPPFDLFSPDAKHGLRLHVKRVFVLEDAEALLPKWLRFVRGVVDSEDLPLNVSRELLQDARLTKTIQKALIKQTLDMLAELAKDKPEDYAAFWTSFGPVLKEALHFDADQAKKILPLLRYATTTSEAPVPLADVKARMVEGQESIAYALGESRDQLLKSPHIEAVTKKGHEVLLMTDPVDGWAVAGLDEFEGVKLVDATKATAPASDDSSKAEKDTRTESLRERIRARLAEHISEVRVSNRLVDSPACLVLPEGGLAPHLERLLRASQPSTRKQKRILEINPDHALVRSLEAVVARGTEPAQVDAYIDLLHAQALLAEGSPPESPADVARQLSSLLSEAVARSLEA